MMNAFETEFREEMKFTYMLLLKYLQIQKEKDQRRKNFNPTGERRLSNAELKSVGIKACSKQDTRPEEFERGIRQALGKDEDDN